MTSGDITGIPPSPFEHEYKMYEAICKQIEREDNLYQLRYGALALFNVGLAAVALTQVMPGPGAAGHMSRVIVFVACFAAALIILFVGNHIMASGAKQIKYLFDEFGKLDARMPADRKLIRPFIERQSSIQSWLSEDWVPIPLVFGALWLVAFVAGLVLILI